MIDLHLHLDGSLAPALVRELAQTQGLPPARRAAWRKPCPPPADCQSLNDYLRCFDLPVAVLQTRQALTQSVQELTARLQGQGLLYAELRFAPSQHTRQGLTQRQVVKAALAGLPQPPAQGRWSFGCQLILCCMRGRGGGRQPGNRCGGRPFPGKRASAPWTWPVPKPSIPPRSTSRSLPTPNPWGCLLLSTPGRPPARRASGRPWSWAPPASATASGQGRTPAWWRSLPAAASPWSSAPPATCKQKLCRTWPTSP